MQILFVYQGFLLWCLLHMTDEVISLEETVDVAIKKAVRVLAILSFPALLISFYRNLYLDFLPSHQLVLSLIWIIFVILSSEFITATPSGLSSSVNNRNFALK